MAQPVPPTYLYNIPSVQASNAGLPGVLGNLDLNRNIQAGAPVDRQNLANAKSVAKGLRVIHGKFLRLIDTFCLFSIRLDLALDNRVTDVVADSAELRATAVEASREWCILTSTISLVTLHFLVRCIGSVYASRHSTGLAKCQRPTHCWIQSGQLAP